MTEPSDAAQKYLLPGVEPSGTSVAFPAPPPRAGCLFEPIVDGIPAIAAMERAIAGATSSVYLSLWVFNPATPVQDTKVRTSGAARWADLLRKAAERGVEVRVLLTDFDPLLQMPLHVNNWAAYETLVHHAARLGGAAAKRLQVAVSRHPATASVKVASRLEAALRAEVKRLNGRRGVDVARLAGRPGIWPLLSYDAKTRKVDVRSRVSLVAYPVSHHQKLLVVDEKLAFCGGLDVNTGRLDTPAHNSPLTAWHDAHVRIEGPAVADACRNFVLRWKAEAPAFDAFRTEVNKAGMPTSVSVHPVTPALTLPKTAPPPAGGSEVQFLRTMSEDDWTPVPETIVDDVARAYRAAIASAKRYIYIENQYVRSPELAEWIVARAKEMPELEVIVVLPVAPEEVSSPGGPDEVTLHGLHLQHDILEKLGKELKSRFGVYSLVKREAAGLKHATNRFGSAQIYVHSKVMIVDDVFVTIGSANASPRSFKIDTELNAACVDPAAATRFRAVLWAELLGNPAGLATWTPGTFVKHWTDIASGNEKAKPQSRRGYVVRHDPKWFPGTAGPSILDTFASSVDPEVGPDRVTV